MNGASEPVPAGDDRSSGAPPAERSIAGFAVEAELGRGRRTVVYRVRRGDGRYAMKVLHRQAGRDPDDHDREFRREAALHACVEHPGLARVHEVGTADGRPYIVMDLVEGQALSTALARGPLPPERVVAVGIDVADTLDAAHRAGLIHRDIKPDNLVLGPDGTARVLDFSLATRSGDDHVRSVAGTVLYCAPEQAGMLKCPLDGRADLYALGAVLFECATGRPPFDAGDVGELLRQHASVPAPDVRSLRPELSAGLAAVIARLLAKDPDDRYPGAAHVADDLRRLAADPDGHRPAPDGPARATVAPTRRALVGRDAERAALVTRWRQAREGAGGGVLVTGAPGGGKSRLADEVVGVATADGLPVLAAKSDPDTSVPLAPLRLALDGYVAHVRALPRAQAAVARRRLIEAAGLAAGVLAALSPAFGELAGVAPVPAHDDRPLAPVAATFLTELARAAGGALLYLDDGQWLDDATLRVLAELATDLPASRLLVVVTVRSDEASADALAMVRQALAEALDTTVALAPLPRDAVPALVAAAAGGMRVDDDTAELLAAHSDGNPFALLEYVAAVIDAGLLRPVWGTWHVDAQGLTDLDLPTDAMALVLKRLDDLDAEGLRLLGVGAVLGARFEVGLVAAVCGVEAHEAMAAATAAERRHLLQRCGPGRYGFLHDRIREALLAQLDEPARRDVHERAADVLETRVGARPRADQDSATVYALAGHCLQGHPDRRPRRVLAVCREAGRRALADHAPDEALVFLRGAEEAAEAAGAEPDPDLLQLLGAAQHRVGRFYDAVASLQRAHDQTAEPRQRARILHQIAVSHDAIWNTSEQIAAVDQALAELGRSLPRNPAALAASTLGRLGAGYLVGRTGIGHGTVGGEQRELYRLLAGLSEATQLAHVRDLKPLPAVVHALRDTYIIRRLGTGPEVARSAAGTAHLARVLHLGHLARKAEVRARHHAASATDPRVRAYVEWVAALDRYFFGVDQGEAMLGCLERDRRWLDLGHAQDLMLVLQWDALLRGDVAGAQRLSDERRELVERSGQTGHRRAHSSDAVLLSMRGKLSEALAYLDGMSAGGDYERRWEQDDILWARIAVALEHDDLGATFDDAVAEHDELGIRPIDQVPVNLGLYAHVAYGRVEQYRAAGRRRAGESERAARRARARSDTRTLGRVATTPLLRAWHHVARASLLQADGEHRAALALLGRDEHVLGAVDAPLLSCEVARLRALALRELGADTEAARQGRHALGVAASHGFPHRVRRLMRELGVRPASTAPGSHVSVNEGIVSDVVRKRLAAIEQVGLAASRVLDPDRLAALALDETIRLLGAERAFLFLVDEDGRSLVPYRGRDAEAHDLRDLTGYSASLVERVRGSGEALVVTGTDEGEALGSASVVLHGLRSIMVAPLALDGRLLGVVYLDSRVAKGIFTTDDVGVLTAITNHVAVAFETARTAQLERAVAVADDRRAMAEAMRDGLGAMSGTLDPDEVLRRLVTTVFRVVGGHGAWLVRPEPGGHPVRVLRLAGGTGADAPTVSRSAPPGSHDSGATAGPGDDDRAAAGGMAVVAAAGAAAEFVEPDGALSAVLAADTARVGDRADAPAFLRAALGRSGGWLAVPLRIGDEHLGAVVLGGAGPAPFGDDRIELAGALVAQGMVAYENARLFVQVQQLATVDALTRCANRRHFFVLSEAELFRTAPENEPVAAMMIDIDHFKEINDRHGHQVGDEVLREVAARLTATLRDDDIIGRYGGEEFAVVTHAELDGAVAMAERLRSAVMRRPVTTAAGPIAVTVSIGVAPGGATADDRHDNAGEAVEALLARADRHLYDAKRRGRNRVSADAR